MFEIDVLLDMISGYIKNFNGPSPMGPSFLEDHYDFFFNSKKGFLKMFIDSFRFK